MPNVQHKRGTRAALDALASANGLLIGQVYLINDEDRIAIATAVNAYSTYVKHSESDTLAVGYAHTPFDAGTKSTGTYTPDVSDGNMQRAINGGAHIIAPPVADCSLVIQYTNNASAGAITFPAFTKTETSELTATDGHDFFFYITKCNGFSSLRVEALQ